jgi:hypothetical protein
MMIVQCRRFSYLAIIGVRDGHARFSIILLRRGEKVIFSYF